MSVVNCYVDGERWIQPHLAKQQLLLYYKTTSQQLTATLKVLLLYKYYCSTTTTLYTNRHLLTIPPHTQPPSLSPPFSLLLTCLPHTPLPSPLSLLPSPSLLSPSPLSPLLPSPYHYLLPSTLPPLSTIQEILDHPSATVSLWIHVHACV